MHIVSIEDDHALIEVDVPTIRLWKAAINETLEALDDGEFQTRTGCTRLEMQEMQQTLNDMIDRTTKDRA